MKSIRVGDYVVLILSVAITALSFFSYGNMTGAPTVHVRVGSQAWVYDVAVDRTLTFSGPAGNTVVEIKDSQVHVASSDCRNKVCVAAGWKKHPGEWIICLPNNVFIMIEGSDSEGEGGVDAVSF